MEPTDALLLEVWREASRHVEIGASTPLIAGLLSKRMPIGLLLVRRLAPDRGTIETVGVGGSESRDRPVSFERAELSPAQRKRVVAWIRRGKVDSWSLARATDAAVPAVVPGEITGNALVAPLVSEHDTMGVLILEARDGRRFNAEHRGVVERLMEPFAAALESDQRLHELGALREAAEADKTSLLRRLGRDALVDEIVGADAGLRQVMQRVEQVVRADAPVLILGETGSGKEVVARAIHTRSRRAVGPFIRVNCGAIPPELIDSELFGHEKGSFTGATGTRRGWFERADEGTLFLDEIGELPAAAQVRLLRILQDGTFERVGGEETIKVDVRIVAATNRDLPALVQVGRFREDLWYRIAVFPIVLPPLREHKQDIAALAEHFAGRAAKHFGLPAQAPTPDDIALLAGYDWPGNVRELASVIDRAAILGDGVRLEIARALGAPAPLGSMSPPPATRRADTPSAVDTLDAAMRRHIEFVLERTRGRVEGGGGAAELLGINPHTLRARMRKLGIDWARFR